VGLANVSCVEMSGFAVSLLRATRLYVAGTMSFVGNFGSFKQKKNAFVPSGTFVPAGAVNFSVARPFNAQENV